MFSQFGPLEIILVIVVLLVIFGPKRLPSLGRQLGGGMREFKDSITGDRKHDDDRADEDASAPAALPRAQETTPPAEAPESQPVDAPPAEQQRG